jgi:hypothetical protein
VYARTRRRGDARRPVAMRGSDGRMQLGFMRWC